MARRSSGGEYIYHIAGVRLRINGVGNFNMFFRSLDAVRSFTLLPLPMSVTTAAEPTRLGNFRSQRTQLEFTVTEIDEYFKISKIIMFVKPSGTSLPG